LERGERLKKGTTRHPKMYALAEVLTIPLPYAIGIITLLWEHAAANTPRGDIGSLPDLAIAQGCAFTRRPKILLDALVDCGKKSGLAGWVDRDEQFRYIIHDWPDHCEQSVIQNLAYGSKDFLPVYGKSIENGFRISKEFSLAGGIG
jgi:hypothetical protein